MVILEEELILLDEVDVELLLDDRLLMLDIDDVTLELDEELMLELELILELETLEEDETLESELLPELPAELDEFETAVPPPLHAEIAIAAAIQDGNMRNLCLNIMYLFMGKIN